MVVKIATVIAAGAATGYLASAMGSIHALIVAAMLAGGIMGITFAIAPQVVLSAYFLLLPLLASKSEGINPSEVISVTVCALGLLVSLITRLESLIRVIVRESQVVCALLLYSIAGGLSVSYNSVTSTSEVASTVLKPIVFLATYLLVCLDIRSLARAKGYITVLIIGSYVATCFALVDYSAGTSYDRFLEHSRAAGTFEHWNQLGGYLVLTSMLSLAFFQLARTRLKRAILAAGFGIQVVALLMTLTLGSMLAFAVTMLVYLILDGRKRTTLLVVFLVVIIVLVSVSLIPVLAAKVGASRERFVDRMAGYYAGISIIRSHFWFGLGSGRRVVEAVWYDSDHRFTPFGQTSAMPHNSYFMAWAEVGILGFAAMVLLSAVCVHRTVGLYRTSRTGRLRPLGVAILASTIGFLAQNMTNNLLLHARLGAVFLTLAAISGRVASILAEEDGAKSLMHSGESSTTLERGMKT